LGLTDAELGRRPKALRPGAVFRKSRWVNASRSTARALELHWLERLQTAYFVEKLARTESESSFQKIDLSERFRFNDRWSVEVGEPHKFNSKRR
jgi:hypothetical protein